jgi:hypothetical protein
LCCGDLSFRFLVEGQYWGHGAGIQVDDRGEFGQTDDDLGFFGGTFAVEYAR